MHVQLDGPEVIRAYVHCERCRSNDDCEGQLDKEGTDVLYEPASRPFAVHWNFVEVPFERSGWYAGWAADQPALLDSAVQISLFLKIATPVDLCAAVAGDSSQTVTLGWPFLAGNTSPSPVSQFTTRGFARTPPRWAGGQDVKYPVH